MIFWLVLTAFTLIVAVICFYPLWRNTTQKKSIQRDMLNKAFYFDRLKEIERDEAQGLLENGAQLKTELQQILLSDIPENGDMNRDSKPLSKIWLLSGFLGLGIIATAAYMKVGAWQAEQMVQKSYEKLPHFYERMKQEETNPLSESEMQQFIMALRVKLNKEPNDAKGWWLLGQLGTNMDNGVLALESYNKAFKLEPENTEYKLSYARMLMFSDDQMEKAKGEQLLKEVVRKDHSNLQALSLLAFNYFEKEDYKMAIVSWAMMLKLLPENDPKIGLIERSIRSARDALEEQEKAKRKQLVPEKEEDKVKIEASDKSESK